MRLMSRLVLGLTLVLAGPALARDRHNDLPAGSRYVAMGSSFAAGAGIGPLQAGAPPRCQRNTNNYAQLLAARLNLSLRDVSCSGATTAHVLGPWDDLPPQLDALDRETRLVTITIGGNDLGYAGGLFGGSCRAGVRLRDGPCPPNVVPDAAKLAALKASLTKIAATVRERAPRARLVFIQYVSLIPRTPCAATVITPGDARTSQLVGRKLAKATTMAARQSGAILLPMDKLSAGHTACSAVPWSNGLSSAFDPSAGAPWHPNAAGHAVIAAALAKALN